MNKQRRLLQSGVQYCLGDFAVCDKHLEKRERLDTWGVPRLRFWAGMGKCDMIRGATSKGCVSMQRLIYEYSWDKAIAGQDRKTIEKVFQETSIPSGQAASFAMIRTAINHKGELLVTGILHHFRKETFTVQNMEMTYKENGKTIAKFIFTVPQIVLEAETSMPWTFIFPVESLINKPALADGQLDFIN